MSGGPLMVYFSHINMWVWTGIINGDLSDMFLYNNSMAAGDQAYPTGIAKYYDLYSWAGYWDYTEDWMWSAFCLSICWLTLGLPLNLWIALFEGYSWDNIWLMFVPSWIGHFFGLEIENGWVVG
jgi:hypothetical protein